MDCSKLNIDIYENGVAVPSCIEGIVSGLYDNNGKYIKYTGRRIYGTNDYLEADRDLTESEFNNFDYLDEEVIYLGFLRAHWGHFLVDSTIRMWSLLDGKWKNAKIIVTSPELPEFYYDVFRTLGIDFDQVCILDRPIRYRKVFVPELSYLPGHFIKKEYSDFFLHLAGMVKLDLPTYEKIYFSRTHFVSKNHLQEYGELRIQKILETGGFVTLYPEEMSIIEQIHYVHNCKVLVTTNGTIAHNVLFAEDESKLVILNRFTEAAENSHQKAINEIKNLKVQTIDSFSSMSNHSLSLMLPTREMREFCEEDGIKVRRIYLGIRDIKDYIQFYLRTIKKRIVKK